MSNNIQLYDKLIELPLFQGMSHNDLEAVIGQTKFDFVTYKDKEVIVNAGSECRGLVLLIDGLVSVETYSDDRSYCFVEELYAPYSIQTEYLFGLAPRYTQTIRAQGVCRVIRLSKTEALRLSDDYFIFKLNLLNIISAKAQKGAHLPWRFTPKDLASRIKRFILSHSERPAGRKELIIKMTQLANEVNDSRLDVSRALNTMQDEGVIELYRGKIIVPRLERLV